MVEILGRWPLRRQPGARCGRREGDGGRREDVGEDVGRAKLVEVSSWQLLARQGVWRSKDGGSSEHKGRWRRAAITRDSSICRVVHSQKPQIATLPLQPGRRDGLDGCWRWGRWPWIGLMMAIVVLSRPLEGWHMGHQWALMGVSMVDLSMTVPYLTANRLSIGVWASPWGFESHAWGFDGVFGSRAGRSMDHTATRFP